MKTPEPRRPEPRRVGYLAAGLRLMLLSAKRELEARELERDTAARLVAYYERELEQCGGETSPGLARATPGDDGAAPMRARQVELPFKAAAS